jgi:hypothetical protein
VQVLARAGELWTFQISVGKVSFDSEDFGTVNQKAPAAKQLELRAKSPLSCTSFSLANCDTFPFSDPSEHFPNVPSAWPKDKEREYEDIQVPIHRSRSPRQPNSCNLSMSSLWRRHHLWIGHHLYRQRCHCNPDRIGALRRKR